ncbi:pyridoxamine 5'-phosphate oxidase family protein [Zavarzinella formosa]|uniref:pyridoxamine 5'-phosphate oxidase family protein n=1 Tax=Zavarzinella formosa TaxID=360055 RepID=UPI00031D67AB|nr:pyridoxamine 5'-phosphate oxidase family protein [Zavarzinella formosa]
MSITPEDKLRELIQEFNTAMLVTRVGANKLHGRPMQVAEIESDGTLWFISGRHSGKMQEISEDKHVSVTMQSATKFVSLSGKASPVEDRERVARMWKPEWEVWFPAGKVDPEIVLLRVDVKSGEYWDNSGASGLKYLIEAGKALLTDTTPVLEDDPKIHGLVNTKSKTGASEEKKAVKIE